MANWRHQVNIKEYFTDYPTDEDTGRLSKILAVQLRVILDKEEGLIEANHEKALPDYFIWEFEELVQNFEWVAESVEDEKDAGEYEYSDWTEAFNNYLECLYDMGDVKTAEGDTWSQNEKFLWIG